MTTGSKGLFLITLLGVSLTVDAQTFECIDSQNRSRYSNSPCESQETTRDLRKLRRGGDRKAISYEEHLQQEREARERETRLKAEQQREKDLLKMKREVRYEEVQKLLEQLKSIKASPPAE